MAEKDSFVLYNSYYDLLEDLDMEQRGTLLTAILEHSRGMDQTELDPITKLAYRVIASQLDRDRKKWERTCKKRAEAGRKGGIASGQARSKTKQNQANEAKASKTKQSQANEAEYEYENDYEDDYENVYENESGYVPPETDGFLNSIKERFIESFGREPDRPFLSGVRNKLAQVSTADVLEVMEIARGKHPGNPEAYIMAALSDRGQRAKPQKPEPSPDDSDRPLEQWEQDWLAEVQRRRAQRGVEQDD